MTFQPMGIGSLRPIIEGVYRDSKPLQFLRELVTNSLEAGASRVEVGPHHHVGETQGIWRFMIRDNGCGMSADQMLTYLNNFGQGGKTIGGAHDNFGIGSKTSLLPWNRAGMVVISYTEDNQRGSMIKLKLDEASGEYGLHAFGDRGVVCAPFDDGVISWPSLRPDWMETGTIVLLMGNTGWESTYLEVCETIDQPSRPHSSIWWAVQSLAQRYWSFADGVEVSAFSFNRKPHPQQRGKANGANRFIKGGRVHAEALAVARGCVELPDQTRVWWYLKDKNVEKDSPAAGLTGGGVAALYKDELYDIMTNGNSLKRFGLTGRTRTRTLLIFEPPMLRDGFGVCPDRARRCLIMQSPSDASSIDLPWDDWSDWWRARLPEALAESMLEDQQTNTSELDSSWADRLRDLFGSRWRRMASYASRGGEEEESSDAPNDGDLSSDGRGPSKTREQKTSGKNEKQLTLLKDGERTRRVSRRLASGDIPSVHWVEKDWSSESGSCRAIAATYILPSSVHPSGLVLLNWDHRIFVEVFQFWCSQYHAQAHIQNDIKETIQHVYQKHITTTIAHAHSFRRDMELSELLSDVSLTCSLMGLYAQDEEIRRALAKSHSKPERVAG